MAAQYALDEADIRQRIDRWAEAIRAMNVDGVIPIYAPHIVSFDLDPPLRYAGADAKRRRWISVFGTYERLLDYEIRDLTIDSGDDLAFGHSLNRVSGTLKNGKKTGFWLRWTTCFRKLDGNWLIVHEQLSVPLDLESGKGLLDLEP